MLLCWCAPLVAQAASNRPVITIAADAWCPVNCENRGDKQGVGIDVARAVFEPLGYEVKYVIMPWSEALARVREGRVDAVVGASKADDASLLFPTQPIYMMSDDFYVLKGISWRYQGTQTLKNKKLGVIKDYGYGAVVRDYIRANQSNFSAVVAAEGANALKDNLRKLQNRELDVVVETRVVMDYTLARMGLSDKFTWAGGVTQDNVFIAFSPSSTRSKALMAQYDAGVLALKNAGKLEPYYKNYGLVLR